MLPAYDVPSDGGDLARFLAGEPEPDPAVVEPWCAWIRAQIARGSAVRSLRVIHNQPGDYLRYELEWGYAVNVAAGMHARVLDLTEQRRPPGFLNEEFWLLDHARAAVLSYDTEGVFLHADAVEGTDALPYVAARDAAWNAAEEFSAWWRWHPEYHRRPDTE